VAAKAAAEDHVPVTEARRCHRARHEKTYAPPKEISLTHKRTFLRRLLSWRLLSMELSASTGLR
jgi:hypothetical protein